MKELISNKLKMIGILLWFCYMLGQKSLKKNIYNKGTCQVISQ